MFAENVLPVRNAYSIDFAQYVIDRNDTGAFSHYTNQRCWNCLKSLVFGTHVPIEYFLVINLFLQPV